MQLKFDDLVLNYDQTVGEIFDFLDIDPALHRKKREHLDPDISKKNAGLWQSVLEDKEKEQITTMLKDLLDEYGWL